MNIRRRKGREPVIDNRLIERLKRDYRLDWNGIHGVSHWARVRRNGLRLARVTGADLKVVELFAFLHDARRRNEGRDPEHGLRAADYAWMLAGDCFQVNDDQLEQLMFACTWHTRGAETTDSTIHTCWDADRLDLWRVGIRPDPARLFTEAGREQAVIEAALRASHHRGTEPLGRA